MTNIAARAQTNGSKVTSLAVLAMLKQAIACRRVLFATTTVELRKKYSGSVLGPTWIVLFPMLLLSVYLFIYLVVFPAKLPQFSNMEYVLYVFCGLVPYMGLLEIIGAGTMAVKQNIHLVKNIMMPIDLIPIRSVMIGMVTEIVSLVFLITLLLVSGSLSWKVIFLPAVLILQFCLMLGFVYILSAIAVSLSDISYFVGLVLTLFMFLSPIGYKPETLAPALAIPVVYLNPAAYMIEAFRDCLLSGRNANIPLDAGFVLVSIVAVVLGAAFFNRFKGILIDYE